MENKRSTSEVGHAKNAANFNFSINVVQQMGGLYNPSNTEIAIGKLLQMRDGLNSALQQLDSTHSNYQTAASLREIAFEQLPKLGTRINNAFRAVVADRGLRENIAGHVRRLRGTSRKKATPTEGEEIKTISNSHLSYDNRAATLQSLISILATHPQYNPNESELQIAELTAYYQTLMEHNNNAAAATAALITARKERNDIMYSNQPNMFEIIGFVKSYVKSVDGAKGYYDALCSVRFTQKK